MDRTQIERAVPVAARLRRGVNLSHWFSQVYDAPGYVPQHFDAWTGDQDFALVASAGFDHVRLPVAFEWLLGGGATASPDRLGRIRRAVEALTGEGLAVVVDAHPEMEFKRELAVDAAHRDDFVAGWSSVAAGLADLPVDRVCFEILNEPGLGDRDLWFRLASDALAAIRAVAPGHAVVVSGDHWSELDEFFTIPRLDDEHLILNFHMYDPLALSHQSAPFAEDWVRQIDVVDYPLDPARLAATVEASPLARTRAELEAYRAGDWGPGRYAAMFERAAAFGAERGAAVTCNEFGIYRGAPAATRAAWLHDTTTALAEAGIGWSVWDLGGDFAVTTGPAGARRLDTQIVRALGLTEDARS